MATNRVTLTEVQEVLEGSADDETRERVAAALRDPGSPLRRMFEAVRRLGSEQPLDRLTWSDLAPDEPGG